jgi:hypothetical protein
MTFLPIAERELRFRARRPGTFLLRSVAASVAVIVAAIILVQWGLRGGGAVVFKTVTALAFLFCLYEGLRNTTDCLSAEKRAGTLGLLFLTDLKGYDVVLGKLTATSLNSFYGLLAILPAIGLPLLIGGVTAGEFWRATLVLLFTLFFSLSAGVFVSSMSWSARRAWATSLGIILLVTVFPVLLDALSFAGLKWASPATAFLLIADADYNTKPRLFSQAIIGINVVSWAFLISACAILPRVWQVRNVHMSRNRDVRRVPSQNVVAWFLSDNEGQRIFVWLFVLACAGALLTMAFFRKATLTTLAVTALVAHFILTAWVAFHSCHSFHEAKMSGAIEQLLPTPLSSREILDGFVGALKRTFEVPVLSLLAIEGLIIIARLADTLSAPSVLVFAVVAWYFLGELRAVALYGMWTALRAKRPNQAFNKAMFITVIIPMSLSLLCCFGVLYPFIAIVKNRVIMNSYEWPLYRDFRRLITET